MNTRNRALDLLLALVPMALWGSLFPMVKIGYEALAVDASSIPDVLVFAALRFTVCGGLLCAFSALHKEKLACPKAKSVGMILLMGAFAIVLHYAFTYIALSTTDAAKTALLKQTGVLVYVCFAFLFLKDETFDVRKLIGALIGFAGIVAINYSPAGIAFSFGDILILLASACTVIATVITHFVASGNSPFWVTGISQLSGGVILLAAGLVMGGRFPSFGPAGIAVFAYILAASIAAYVLWTAMLARESVSRLFIIKFAEPLFACLFGALLLGENILRLQYCAAFFLISAGILIAERAKEGKQ